MKATSSFGQLDALSLLEPFAAPPAWMDRRKNTRGMGGLGCPVCAPNCSFPQLEELSSISTPPAAFPPSGKGARAARAAVPGAQCGRCGEWKWG